MNANACGAIPRVLTRTWVLAVSACVMISACKADPQRREARLKQVEPAALAAAQERGRLDLNCEQVKTSVISKDAPATWNAYELFRPEFRIAAQGCGKRTEFTVACTDEGYCTAMSQNAVIEPAK
jgi:hypothetical protein